MSLFWASVIAWSIGISLTICGLKLFQDESSGSRGGMFWLGMLLIVATFLWETQNQGEGILTRMVYSKENIQKKLDVEAQWNKYAPGRVSFQILCAQKGIWDKWKTEERLDWEIFKKSQGFDKPAPYIPEEYGVACSR